MVHPGMVARNWNRKLFWHWTRLIVAGEKVVFGPWVGLEAGCLGAGASLFEPIWALPDRTLHRLGDAENSPTIPAVRHA